MPKDERERVAVLKSDLELALETLKDGELAAVVSQLEGLIEYCKPTK